MTVIRTWQVRQSGRGHTGIDGALYAPADFIARPGAPAVPAVVITAPVPSAEIVTGFESEVDRSCWLSDRSDSTPGLSLYSCLAGPECRTVREERVLAWMLRRAHGGAEPWPELSAGLFTAPVRAEILLAWRDLAARTARRGDWLVDAELRSRLSRAPGWAEISDGPDGPGSSLYLYRLASTPVTREQAEAAAAWLTAQAGPAMPAGPDYFPAPRGPGAGGAPGRVLAADAPEIPLEAPPRPEPGGPGGPVQGR